MTRVVPGAGTGGRTLMLGAMLAGGRITPSVRSSFSLNGSFERPTEPVERGSCGPVLSDLRVSEGLRLALGLRLLLRAGCQASHSNASDQELSRTEAHRWPPLTWVKSCSPTPARLRPFRLPPPGSKPFPPA